MADFKKFPIVAETGHQYATDVLVLADAMGNAPVLLVEVMQDFLRIVREPIIAGGFAVAHHGFTRGTLDIDVFAFASVKDEIEQFKTIGYKHESLRVPIGAIDLLTKGNKGVDFIHMDDQAFVASVCRRTVIGEMLNQKVRVVSLEDLIVLKSLSVKGRKSRKDPIDLEQLLEKPHDKAYVETWLRHFGLS